MLKKVVDDNIKIGDLVVINTSTFDLKLDKIDENGQFSFEFRNKLGELVGENLPGIVLDIVEQDSLLKYFKIIHTKYISWIHSSGVSLL